MLRRIFNLWSLALLCAFLAGVFAFPIVWGLASIQYHHKNAYVARTTLMEYIGPPVAGQADYYNRRFGDLFNLATSQGVLSRTAETLNRLGMSATAEQAITNTTLFPVKDTHILAIEVTLPDPRDAKIAADVLAAETKKEYATQHESDIKRGFVLRTIDPAFVRPYDPHPGEAIYSIVSHVWPIEGVVVGLALGLAIAAIRNRRKEGRLNA